MQIFVKNLYAKTVVYEVYPCTRVDTLKAMIRDREGIPMDMQRLSNGCTILEDTRTLHDQGIVAETNIALLLRLRGGMAKVKKEQTDTSVNSKATKKATSNVKKATKNAKTKNVLQSGGNNKQTKAKMIENEKDQRKQRDREANGGKASREQRLVQFARDVETLRLQALKSEGSAKAFASRLQVISDKHYLKDILYPVHGEFSSKRRLQEEFKIKLRMEEEKQLKYQQEQAEVLARQPFWGDFGQDVQSIKQEAGLDGTVIKQEDEK